MASYAKRNLRGIILVALCAAAEAGTAKPEGTVRGRVCLGMHGAAPSGCLTMRELRAGREPVGACVEAVTPLVCRRNMCGVGGSPPMAAARRRRE